MMRDKYILTAAVLFIFGGEFHHRQYVQLNQYFVTGNTPMFYRLETFSSNEILGQEELEECGCPDAWIKFNGSCYMIGHNQGMFFMDAEKYCERLNGHLVRVETIEENNFLKNYLSRMKDANYWIGANDRLTEGVWNYVDTGDLVTFTDWSPGQPDSWHAHNEDCALFYYPHQYLWDDGACEQNLEPICEKGLPEANVIDIIG